MAKEKAVVVTTEYRGVFFGYTNGDGMPDGSERVLTIKRARNCVFWHANVKGFLGLASAGPTKECRIGPAVPSFVATRVTAVIECTPEAVKAWEAAPWML